MAETQTPPRVVRFGLFEADLRTGELRKGGVKLKFSGQPFQVLAILLERPGEVVTREELQKRLWPDTFVDVERNLNTAVNKTREALGDSAETPRFVETLPRRGYRFVAAIEPSSQPATVVEPESPPRTQRANFNIALGLFAIAGIVAAIVFTYRRPSPHSPPESGGLNAIPFTALPGEENPPAFSPDGSRIAFAWNGDPASGGKGFDLYVKAIGSETLLQLTHHPSESIRAAWSPDGTQIVFHRLAGADTGIYIVPALGGPERRLSSTQIPPGWDDATTVSWSSDGKWIAFTNVGPDDDHGRIYLYSTETSEIRKMDRAPGCSSDGGSAFSHKGARLAYGCMRSFSEEVLYFREVPDGKPQMIAVFRNYPHGMTWSADDTALIHSMGTGYSEMSEIELANGSVKSLPFALSAESPTVSPRGSQLAFSASTGNTNIWRKDLQHPQSPAVEVAPSSRQQFHASYSSDGSRIVFASRRGGPLGIWIGNDDGSNLVEISNPADESGSPEWSPDGRKVAFDSHPRDSWEIQVADVTERVPRKLITNLTNIFQPHWSRDGQWIYFHSDQVGKEGLYRCPASGGDAVLVSGDIDARAPQESFDGATCTFQEA
jgi:Tol biopolymer transport system component/DNA-binding winged helix-turn-helix (wHTH) protein